MTIHQAFGHGISSWQLGCDLMKVSGQSQPAEPLPIPDPQRLRDKQNFLFQAVKFGDKWLCSTEQLTQGTVVQLLCFSGALGPGKDSVHFFCPMGEALSLLRVMTTCKNMINNRDTVLRKTCQCLGTLFYRCWPGVCLPERRLSESTPLRVQAASWDPCPRSCGKQCLRWPGRPGVLPIRVYLKAHAPLHGRKGRKPPSFVFFFS